MSNAFDLEYLVDNGRLTGWASDFEHGCMLVHYIDDDDYSVHDAHGKPLGWGETEKDAISSARYLLTKRRREKDGVVPKRIA